MPGIGAGLEPYVGDVGILLREYSITVYKFLLTGQVLTSDTSVEKFSLTTSRGFTRWLASVGGSLAFTTYQAGKIFFLGVKPEGKLTVFERTFPRCMGLSVSADGQTLLLGTHYQLYRFDNLLPHGERHGDYDAVYRPNQSWITGDLDIHDVDIDQNGLPIFVNTQFNCLASVTTGYSFKPIWRPEFISDIVAEDRCHLNGMAVENGLPHYVTCISKSDVVDGWRDDRETGGMVIDVRDNRVVCEDLSMPHSPRLYKDKLWLLNSGTGEFGWIDIDQGEFHPLTFCPGYARGLSFVGDYAIIGLSEARENKTFQGLALDEALKTRNAMPRCGLLIVDINSGQSIEWVRLEGIVKELFDVTYIPNSQCPSAIGLKGSEILKILSIDPA